MAYDGLDKQEKIIYPPCEPEFVDGHKIVNEYQDWICEALIDYGRDGLFIEGFVGKYNINQVNFNKWITAPDGEYEQLKAARNVCFSASIHVWCSRLNHAVQNSDWQAVGQIKAILSEMMKSVPKHFREGMSEGYNPEDPEEKQRLERIQLQRGKLSALAGTNG